MASSRPQKLQVDLLDFAPFSEPRKNCGAGPETLVGATFTVRVMNILGDTPLRIGEAKAVVRDAEILCDPEQGKVLCQDVALQPGEERTYTDTHSARVRVDERTPPELQIIFAWGPIGGRVRTTCVRRQLPFGK